MNRKTLTHGALFGFALVAGIGLLAHITVSESAFAQGSPPGVGSGAPGGLHWQIDGDNLFYLGGRVGINTDQPLATLHVAEGLEGLGLHLPGLRVYQNANTPNVIGGHFTNEVAEGVFGATICGGGHPDFPNRVLANRSAVGGGLANVAAGTSAVVGGGQGNQAIGNRSTVSGGDFNRTSEFGATVGGGQSNHATGERATIAGGFGNLASGQMAAIGAGQMNLALGDWATVAGGRENEATGLHATVGGGFVNTAASSYATVAGGLNNHADGMAATVGGGQQNQATDSATVSGGLSNVATAFSATVSGGIQNVASGMGATIPGGSDNMAAGARSFAAGNRAVADHSGSFVWGDNTNANITSSANNQMTFRSVGGVRIFTNTNLDAGVTLAAGGSSWASVSDRNAKENFAEVDPRDILDRLANVPITSWNYKSQSPDIRHIGPTAQDFHAAFSFGEDELRITTLDADGIALAAIQGLYDLVRERDAEIDALRERIARIELLLSTAE